MNPLAIAGAVGVGLLVTLLGVQTVRLSHEQAAHEATKTAFAEHRTIAARAALAQNEAFEAQASGWRQAQQENALAHRTYVDELLRDNAGLRAAGDKLRARTDQLRAAAGQAPRDPGAEPSSPTASEAADLLAYVSRRIDEAAERIGEFAEGAHGAGQLCERDYDALKLKPTASP